MPKEIVYGTYEACVDMEGNEVNLSDTVNRPTQGYDIMRRGAVLRWNREVGYVQLATSKINVSSGIETEGQYIQLDRSAINKLISDLRTARNQAFGKDQ